MKAVASIPVEVVSNSPVDEAGYLISFALYFGSLVFFLLGGKRLLTSDDRKSKGKKGETTSSTKPEFDKNDSSAPNQ